MSDIANYLFSRRSSGCTPEHLAGVLGSVGWLMDDDGAEIATTLRQWLEHGHSDQVRVALAYNEGLFRSREEAERLLGRAGARFPEFRPCCDKLLEAWGKKLS